MTVFSARPLLDDRRGTGAVEMALVLPMLLLMLLGMVDLSRFIAARIDLEQAAQRTTDFALARRPTTDNGSYLETEAASAAGVSANNVTVDIYLECDGVRASDFRIPCTGGQTQARFVNVEIERTVPSAFNWGALGSLFGSSSMDSNITVSGDSIVRFQ
ncbi:MAG: pilus assembly protein [Novosphingobium sp.]|nr:pilus assembly protein [Novosphingobium sp.]